MTRYHIRPSSGEPGVCKAEKYCPFGDMVHDHFENKLDARIAYERMMEGGDFIFTRVEKVNPRPPMRNAIGLTEAQVEFVRHTNEQFLHDPDFIAPHAENYANETIDRYFAGERIETSRDYWVEALEPRDRLLSILTNPRQGTMSRQELYLSTIFPERELRGALEHMTNPPQITVSTFFNGRENGLVYSVMQPDGQLRSFSVYEHRNSDSIIINGKTNWVGEELPYAGENKNEFFAEFSHENYAQVASALSFYLSEASRGELADDGELCNSAEKIDWVANLSKQIPGFGDWAKTQGYEPKKRWFED